MGGKKGKTKFPETGGNGQNKSRSECSWVITVNRAEACMICLDWLQYLKDMEISQGEGHITVLI